MNEKLEKAIYTLAVGLLLVLIFRLFGCVADIHIGTGAIIPR